MSSDFYFFHKFCCFFKKKNGKLLEECFFKKCVHWTDLVFWGVGGGGGFPRFFLIKKFEKKAPTLVKGLNFVKKKTEKKKKIRK